MRRRCLLLLVVFLALAACREREEPARSESLQTVGVRLEAPGLAGSLELALSMPEHVDARPVVEALSGALHQAMKTCAVDAEPLRLEADRTVGLRLTGTAIAHAWTEPGPGTACFVAALEKHALSRSFEPAFDVHVLLRKPAST